MSHMINLENILDGLLVIVYKPIIFFSILVNCDLKKLVIMQQAIGLVSTVSKRIRYDFWLLYHNIFKIFIQKRLVSNTKPLHSDDERRYILMLIILDMNMIIHDERRLIFLFKPKGEYCSDYCFINMVYHIYNLQIYSVLWDVRWYDMRLKSSLMQHILISW